MKKRQYVSALSAGTLLHVELDVPLSLDLLEGVNIVLVHGEGVG
jgi:hypothetical protein